MGRVQSNRLMVFLFFLVSNTLNLLTIVRGDPQVPCYFVFGDSLFDNGNNNVLKTTAKVNYPPYGIDYPQGPTGRFTNGRNIPDVIAELLLFSTPSPPFATANDQDILRGVNYASGGAGILEETGRKNLGDGICLGRQLKNHQKTVENITTRQDSLHTSAMDYLGKCLYTVGIGSNDYINNYFMPNLYNSSHQYNPNKYAEILIRQYTQQLYNLYRSGARKVALFGLGPIGCIPTLMEQREQGRSCSDAVNIAVQFFNAKLKTTVDNLNKKFTDANFIYVNVLAIAASVPPVAGVVADAPCCKVSSSTGLCIPKEAPCLNRYGFSFFDEFHPTEGGNLLVANRAYRAQVPFDTYPKDIAALVYS